MARHQISGDAAIRAVKAGDLEVDEGYERQERRHGQRALDGERAMPGGSPSYTSCTRLAGAHATFGGRRFAVTKTVDTGLQARTRLRVSRQTAHERPR
jgi:hypothetical protein